MQQNKKVRVAFIGNMNHMFFTVVRYLRDKGYDADLFGLYEALNFQPDTDTYSDEYKKYFTALTLPDSALDRCEAIRNTLASYDFIVGCGYAPFLCRKVDRVLDVFIPYGSDLYQLPFEYKQHYGFRTIFWLDKLTGRSLAPKILWKLNKKTYYKYSEYMISPLQLEGIRSAKRIMSYGSFEHVVRDMGLGDKLLQVPTPMVYDAQYSTPEYNEYKRNSKVYQEYSQLRKENDIVIFHHSRQMWKNLPDKYSNKGNDRLFKGVAMFLKKFPDVEVCIICFEYGPDVETSKQLIKDLGIERSVVWKPASHRKDIMPGIEVSDFGGVNFATSWAHGGVLFEFLAMQKPVMQYYDDNAELGDIYPFVKTNTEEDVCRALEDFIRDKNKYVQIGKDGAAWYQRHVVDVAVNKYEEIFGLKAS